jgi:beta-mannosidase
MQRMLRRLVVKSLILGFAGIGAWDAQAQSRSEREQGRIEQNAAMSLDQGWEFRQVVSNSNGEAQEWLPATVPGDVHLDLLANKKITDAFYRDNEAKLQWIEDASWEYRLNFDATAEFLARSNVDLVFDGIDAAAQVYLNDALVLNADNMFRIWRVPAKDHLRVGKNQLRIVFPSPIKAAEEVAAGDPFRLQSKTADKTYIRKAAYEYGWDWGPRFVTSGVWRPVHLEAWDKARIADFAIRQRDVSTEVAHLDAEVEIEAASSSGGPASVMVKYLDEGKAVTLARRVDLHAGRNVIDLPIEIQRPKLWYPAGYGEQPLYEFTASVGTVEQGFDQRKTKAGLRSIQLRRQLDKWGRSFELVVNGIPVFAKGPTSFLSTVSPAASQPPTTAASSNPHATPT